MKQYRQESSTLYVVPYRTCPIQVLNQTDRQAFPEPKEAGNSHDMCMWFVYRRS